MAEPRDTIDKVASQAPMVHKSGLVAADQFTVIPDDLKLYLGSDGDADISYNTTDSVVELNGARLRFDGGIRIADDQILQLGDGGDQALVNRSTTLAANTALANVVIGTPVTQALAANSLIVSNITASGDIILAANRGGNSEEYVFIDGSAGKLTLTSPADNLVLQAKAAGKKILINSFTSTDTASSIMGFQSKPAAGASTGQNVIGCEISPRVNDTFALTGTGTLIGAHIDAYLKGTTGNVGGDVRGAQIELVTDDAGTRTISGDVIGLRMRAAFSGTITGNMIAFSVEKAETQTNSKQWEYLFELTGDNGLIWRDDYTTEVSTAGSVAGAIKVLVNGADRWIALYNTAPTV